MTNPIYTVYKIINTINQKIYIGVHKTTNPNDSYFGSGTAIKRAIKKYGKESFIKSILFEYDNSFDMFDKESELVDENFINSSNTYNLKTGGNGNYQHSQQTKDKISKSNKGKMLSNDHKSKLRIIGFHRKHSQQTKDKMSKSRKGMIFTKDHCNNISISAKKRTKYNFGRNNHNYIGDYVTPWGIFESSYDFPDYVNKTTIIRWCKNSDKIISKNSYIQSPYLKSLSENPVGKTFKNLGFTFKKCI